jgi:hypothetical protein
MRSGAPARAGRYVAGAAPGAVVELAELEVNVLEFVHKNFSFARTLQWKEQELAVFQRTETENEAKFRPKIIHLVLVVPTDWVIYDLAADLLVLGSDGHTPGPRPVGTAVEAAAETQEFREQGIAFHRFPVGSVLLYVPQALADELTTPAGRVALGLDG